MSPVLWGQDEERLSHWDWAKQEILDDQCRPQDLVKGVFYGWLLSMPFWILIFYMACSGE